MVCACPGAVGWEEQEPTAPKLYFVVFCLKKYLAVTSFLTHDEMVIKWRRWDELLMICSSFKSCKQHFNLKHLNTVFLHER